AATRPCLPSRAVRLRPNAAAAAAAAAATATATAAAAATTVSPRRASQWRTLPLVAVPQAATWQRT
ncbi:MAG: hypothetical protein ACK4ZJ_19825, partial [Allorhizobium sp.]